MMRDERQLQLLRLKGEDEQKLNLEKLENKLCGRFATGMNSLFRDCEGRRWNNYCLTDLFVVFCSRGKSIDECNKAGMRRMRSLPFNLLE